MTWSAETSCGYEQDKIAAFVLQYLGARSLDLGCGARKCWPFMLGVDRGGAADMIGDIADLSMFADASFDSVFSSHALEDFQEERVPAVLAEWARVLKPGGRLCLYVPSANLYPLIGEPGANPAHRWNIYPGDIERHLLAATSCGWTQVECEERGEANEYSLFEVYAKRTDGQYVRRPWQRNPDGKKRVLLCRFGAIGDQIVASSVLPGLKRQGYHVTYMTTPQAAEIVKHDPHIDEFLLQEKDACPNVALGPYWDTLATRYDRFINLSESVEGALLTLPGRLTHQYPAEVRRRMFGTINYLERTHDIAGVPYDFAPRFFPTGPERAQALAKVRGMDGPAICWAINGSSPHKVYPWTHIVVSWLLSRTPAHVVLMADPGVGLQLQNGMLECLRAGGSDMARVHGIAGDWPIRRSLAFCQVAHCVVGPETGPLNAVCIDPVPKVIYLSHSSAENLTKHWRNTTVLEPDGERAPCFPCHRLHSTWEHCHQDEKTNAALCASAIAPERVFAAIMESLGARKAA